MPEISIFIHISHIARIIPSVPDVKRGLFEVIEISLHHILSLDEDLSDLARLALLPGFIMLDADFHARNRTADASRFVCGGSVHRNSGACFGRPVCLKKLNGVLRPKLRAQGIGTLIGPREGDPHTLKISRFRFAHVPPQETRRADHKRATLLANDITNGFIIDGICITDERHSVIQGRPEICCLAKDMEIGEVCEKGVLMGDFQH